MLTEVRVVLARLPQKPSRVQLSKLTGEIWTPNQPPLIRGSIQLRNRQAF